LIVNERSVDEENREKKTSGQAIIVLFYLIKKMIIDMMRCGKSLLIYWEIFP
jgi:hypothetical protein